MKLRTLFGMTATVFVLLALGFLLDPPTLLKFFGFTAGTSEELLAKMLGAAFMAFAALAWLAREIVDPTALQGALWALISFSAIAFVVTLLGVMAKTTRAGGAWVLVVVFLLSAVSFAYYQFSGTRE
jgi:hypothetical protein